jgi:flagellar biosynthesis GTPase FlhF
MKEEGCYGLVAEEIESGRQDRALWARALAESGGDSGKTKAYYIRRRIAAMTADSSAPAATSDSGLQKVRTELRRQIVLQGKNSLYAVLGVPADCSDADVAAAIRRIAAPGSALTPEIRYAVEVLGDPDAREQFDRRLLDQLNPPKPAAVSRNYEPATVETTGMGGGFNLMTVALLMLGVGYLGLSYFKEKSEREIRIKETEIRRIESERAATAAELAAAERKAAMEISIAEQAKAAQSREVAQIETRMREDHTRFERTLQQEQRTAQAEQARQQAETRRKEAESAAAARALRQQLIQDAMARGNVNEAQRLRNQQY